MASILDKLRAAWAALGTPLPRERAEDAHVQLAPPTISNASVSSVRSTLEAHEQGSFAESAALVEHMLREADLQQALSQRVLGVLGAPCELQPADDSAEAKALAEEAKLLWPRMAPAPALQDCARWMTTLGFAVAQVLPCWDEERGELVPCLDPWHPAWVDFDANLNLFFALTAEGRIPIVPGDGRWVLFSPWSTHRSHMYGAVRALGEWFLRGQMAGRDASRWSEVRGQGVWVARMPLGALESKDGKAFIQSIRNLGRAGVVPAPRGATPEQSYDLEVREAQSDGWEGFDFLLRRASEKFRLAILGQDFTSANAKNGTYASAKVGNDVRQDVKEADARALGETLHAQLLGPWAAYKRGKRSLAPKPWWNVSPPEDVGALATAWQSAGAAVLSWQSAGLVVDLEAAAKAVRLPHVAGARMPKPAAPKAPAKDEEADA